MEQNYVTVTLRIVLFVIIFGTLSFRVCTATAQRRRRRRRVTTSVARRSWQWSARWPAPRNSDRASRNASCGTVSLPLIRHSLQLVPMLLHSEIGTVSPLIRNLLQLVPTLLHSEIGSVVTADPALTTARFYAPPHWNRHSVVTDEQQAKFADPALTTARSYPPRHWNWHSVVTD